MPETKHLVLLAVAVGLGYRYSRQPTPTYWDSVERWQEEDVAFLTPVPVEQAVLYRTAEEVIQPLQVPAQGEVPSWLAGTLIRDGPGLMEFGEEAALHAFDGMAMLRRYHTEPTDGGQAMNYSRRLVDSDILASNRREARFTKYGLGTPAKGGVLDRLRGMGEPGADNVVVQSLVVHGHYYAATELPQVGSSRGE